MPSRKKASPAARAHKKISKKPTHPGFPKFFFRGIFRDLSISLGPSHWWPARTSFEVMVGAVLTQNTNWRNVERAMGALRRHKLLNARRMHALSPEVLAPIIRSSGYYNQKAIKLHALLDWFARYKYSIAQVQRAFPSNERDRLRAELLAIRGLGPETVDSILCYALKMPYFTVDSYTMRWMRRYRPDLADCDYETLREAVEQEFRGETRDEAELTENFNELHGLFVRLGSSICQKRNPACPQCPLEKRCAQQLDD